MLVEFENVQKVYTEGTVALKDINLSLRCIYLRFGNGHVGPGCARFIGIGPGLVGIAVHPHRGALAIVVHEAAFGAAGRAADPLVGVHSGQRLTNQPGL